MKALFLKTVLILFFSYAHAQINLSGIRTTFVHLNNIDDDDFKNEHRRVNIEFDIIKPEKTFILNTGINYLKFQEIDRSSYLINKEENESIFLHFNSGKDSVYAQKIKGDNIYRNITTHYLGIILGTGITTGRLDKVKFTSLLQINPMFLVHSSGVERVESVEALRAIEADGQKADILHLYESYELKKVSKIKSDAIFITRILFPLRFEYSPFSNTNLKHINLMFQLTPGIKIQPDNNQLELRTNLGISYFFFDH